MTSYLGQVEHAYGMLVRTRQCSQFVVMSSVLTTDTWWQPLALLISLFLGFSFITEKGGCCDVVSRSGRACVRHASADTKTTAWLSKIACE